uniref:DNA methylase adenine-specific domain-containing protein n=1 Tax=Spiroplasma citri TaxID=2133 RepID=Q14KA5_SPICI|nr:hypothetical protein SPICINP17_004 [Spiroplasma citri]
MYRIDRNNYFDNQKKSTVYTPNELSEYLFNLLKDKISKGYIFDPCVGKGSLLKPWGKAGWEVKGVDIENQGFKNTILKNYLEITLDNLDNKKPALIVMNPPFNIDIKTQEYIKNNKEKFGSSRPFLPEVWLKKVIELFGKNIPILMFTPYGFRLNPTSKSARWKRFIKNDYPEISSIISLPKDIYKEVMFHSEIIIYNINNLRPHYFFNK